MKNKALYIIPTAIVAIALFAYFAINNPFSKKEPSAQNGKSESEENEQMGNSEDNNQSEQLPMGGNGDGSQENPPVSQMVNNIVTDDFQITPPPGWEGRPAPEGLLAIAIKPNEAITDPAAVKIGFKSYLAVTRDNLQGKTKEDYVNFIGEELKKASLSVSLDTTWSTKVDGRDATVLDVSMNQQNVDFKASIFLVWDGEDVWAISFNTTEDKWNEYKDSFFTSGSSFKLK
jgi:hypothetical protein